MRSVFWFLVAALGEIGGCFAVWTTVRGGRSPLWFVPGVIALTLFALALTRVDAAQAGRAYAAYGGFYIVAALVWLWAVEGVRPDRWDVLGGCVCLVGAAIILGGPRHP